MIEKYQVVWEQREDSKLIENFKYAKEIQSDLLRLPGSNL